MLPVAALLVSYTGFVDDIFGTTLIGKGLEDGVIGGTTLLQVGLITLPRVAPTTIQRTH